VASAHRVAVIGEAVIGEAIPVHVPTVPAEWKQVRVGGVAAVVSGWCGRCPYVPHGGAIGRRHAVRPWRVVQERIFTGGHNHGGRVLPGRTRSPVSARATAAASSILMPLV
jgi:hypothetical protein